MKGSKNFLYILFYIFIVVDIILLVVFFINPKFLQKPEFKTSSPQFTFNQGEIKLSPGEKRGDNYLFGIAYLRGNIKSSPYYKKSINNYILPIDYVDKNGKKLTLNIVLGEKDDEIYITKAKKGIIPDKSGYEKDYKVVESLNFFKKKTPLIVQYYYDSTTSLNKMLNVKKCGDFCKKNVEKIKLYAPNTYALLNNLEVKNEALIGPANSFIIYEN